MRFLTPLAVLLVACTDGGPAPTDPVDTANLPPRADPGPALTVASGDEVRLEGAVTDPDGSIATFAWEQTSGPTVSLQDADQATARFVAPDVDGTALLGFALTVTDEEGASDTARTTVLVEGSTGNRPPQVGAGDPQVVDEGASVVITGSATDPDGTVVTTLWTVAGGSVSLSGLDTPTVSFVAPATTVPLDLALTLTATDDGGLAASDTVVVRVLPVNASPSVDAGTDQTVHAGSSVGLAAIASDPDGSIVSTAWTQLAGAAVTFDDPLSASPGFTAPLQEGPLLFQVTATDDEGATAQDQVLVDVLAGDPSGNQPPIVDAGPDQTVDGGVTVDLTGSASDADGAVAQVLWTQLAGIPVTLDSPDQLDPSFVAPAVTASEQLVFQLQVTDDDGAVSSATVAVRVDPGGDPPVADAGTDLEVLEGQVVSLAGSASDPDGTVATTTWTQLSGPPVTLSDPDALDPQLTTPTVGRVELLVFRLLVVDDTGLSASDTVTVRVEPVNLPPLVDAGSDQSVIEGTDVTLGGTASDPDGTLASVAWVQLQGPAVALDDPADLTPSFTAPIPGIPTSLVFQLTVTDDEGATSADTVTITVGPETPANLPPTAYAGSDTTVGDGSVAQLVGTASDPDGSVASTVWSQVSGPAVSLTDPSALSTDFVAPDVQCAVALVFELTVTDDLGAERSDRVTVVVEGDLDEANVLSMPVHLDLEVSDGALLAEGSPWAWGPPTSGPSRAWDGVNVWGTALNGNYANNDLGWLCLPPIDRAGVTDAVLSFRMYAAHSSGDGSWVEALVPDQGWVQIGDVDPAYDRTSPIVGWASQGQVPIYTLATVALPPSLPDPVRLRFAFDADGGFAAPGTYLDEIRVDAESSDPDGDGITGVRAEVALGVDPFLADTDGDGVVDGVELDGGTDPLDPSDFEGDVVAVAPFFFDFETGSEGLVADGGGWERGTPSAGVSVAHSGANVWGTNLDGNYGNHQRAVLYLPQIDLGALTEPTLSFRVWSRMSSGDAFSVQLEQDGVWTVIPPATPAYGATDPLGNVGFGSLGRYVNYELALFDLSAWAGETVRLRLALNSDGGFTGVGALVDDLAVTDEGSDPDGDGLFGVMDEFLAYGTDPFLADSDADGELDGDEVSGGTEPLNPADYAGAIPLAVGEHLDLELDPGRCVADGEGWAWGTVGSGPNRSWDGSNGWATNLVGITGNNRRMGLYLPPIDLTGASEPVLSFRLWSRHGNGDATSLQAWSAVEQAWTNVSPVTPAYQSNGPVGDPGWTTQGYLSNHVLAAFALQDWVGDRVLLRVMTATDGGFNDSGAYLDELRLDEEGSDPDADGLPGVLAELAAGTDPFLLDTDFDGIDDGQEVADGTDPTNPADWLGSPVWTIGSRIDLNLDDGGLATTGDTWAYGAPGQGPLAGYTGDRVWATGLAANYGANRREPLYLPAIDLSGAAAPVLVSRAWADNRDAFNLEIYDPVAGWTLLNDVTPPYDRTDVLGYAAWDEPNAGTWGIVGADLSTWAGQLVHLRFVFRSDGGFNDPGVFLDDLAVDDDLVDHDGDGLIGLLAEYGAYGTDPFTADSDGDGVHDGAEVGAGTDPLDPASF